MKRILMKKGDRAVVVRTGTLGGKPEHVTIVRAGHKLICAQDKRGVRTTYDVQTGLSSKGSWLGTQETLDDARLRAAALAYLYRVAPYQRSEVSTEDIVKAATLMGFVQSTQTRGV